MSMLIQTVSRNSQGRQSSAAAVMRKLGWSAWQGQLFSPTFVSSHCYSNLDHGDHYIVNTNDNKTFEIIKCPTDKMLADYLTKQLVVVLFSNNRKGTQGW